MPLSPIVYIADLRHTSGGVVANSYMPVGIGYMKSVMNSELPAVECTTFAYPDELFEAIKLNPPDVLMLTNYMWNERLSQHFTKVMKGIRSETLVVAGGPNISLDKERQIEYFKNWDGLDVYALGEGDFLATEIVNRFLDAGKSIPKLAKNGIPSSIFSLDGQIVHQEVQKKGNELAKIPSPWLNGAQDHFFDGKLIPMIETNRGCPFKCTFCVQGSDYYDRVAQFPADQVIEELTYIARRIKKVCPSIPSLAIADANFAMFKRDLAISAHIGQLQKDYGWPGLIACSTGKNAPELIVKSIELANGALEMLHAVQSMDENVLKSIKRSNIKLDTYNKVTKHLRKKGIRTSSQVILGLPQETLKGHLDGLRELIDKGIDSMQNLQLVLLKGTDMESQDDREKYGFETKFRLTILGYGNYSEGSRVFDVEETVTSTKTLSSEDYLNARIFHLGSGIYWNQDWFNDLFYYAQSFGIKFSECIDEIIKEMHADKGVVGKLAQDFVGETKAELFVTPEECIKFYSEDANFEKLNRGEIGDNLMNKYRAIASFLIWPEVSQLAAKAVKKLIIKSQKVLPFEVDQFFGDLCKFVEAKHAAGDNEDKLFSSVSCQLQYDIPKWVLDGHSECIEEYRLEEPSNYIFKLNEMRFRELKKAINTFSMDILGLTKAVRHVKANCQDREGEKINTLKEEHLTSSGSLV